MTCFIPSFEQRPLCCTRFLFFCKLPIDPHSASLSLAKEGLAALPNLRLRAPQLHARGVLERVAQSENGGAVFFPAPRRPASCCPQVQQQPRLKTAWRRSTPTRKLLKQETQCLSGNIHRQRCHCSVSEAFKVLLHPTASSSRQVRFCLHAITVEEASSSFSITSGLKIKTNGFVIQFQKGSHGF